MKNTIFSKRFWSQALWSIRHRWAIFAEQKLPVSAKQHSEIFDAMYATNKRLEKRVRSLEGACPCKSVYVVVANDCERVKECIVFSEHDRAWSFYLVCKDIYGGANVAFCARRLDDVPRNIRESQAARLENLIS